LEDLGIDGRIILKCTLEKRWEVVGWIHLAQDGLKHGNNPLSFIKGWEFLNQAQPGTGLMASQGLFSIQFLFTANSELPRI
jgi:hypothetical protein